MDAEVGRKMVGHRGLTQRFDADAGYAEVGQVGDCWTQMLDAEVG